MRITTKYHVSRMVLKEADIFCPKLKKNKKLLMKYAFALLKKVYLSSCCSNDDLEGFEIRP